MWEFWLIDLIDGNINWPQIFKDFELIQVEIVFTHYSALGITNLLFWKHIWHCAVVALCFDSGSTNEQSLEFWRPGCFRFGIHKEFNLHWQTHLKALISPLLPKNVFHFPGSEVVWYLAGSLLVVVSGQELSRQQLMREVLMARLDHRAAATVLEGDFLIVFGLFFFWGIFGCRLTLVFYVPWSLRNWKVISSDWQKPLSNNFLWYQLS